MIRFLTNWSCRQQSGLGIWMLGLLMTSLFVSPVQGQQDERAVRAAFVYNLTKYVEWPQPGNELVIGFVGDGETGEILQKMLAGKASEPRSIRILLTPSDAELERCDILYIGYTSPKRVGLVLERLRNKSILTVGEDESFAKNGGMVGLVRTSDHIQIQINLDVVQQSGLKISSRLLNLAAIVRSNGGAD